MWSFGDNFTDDLQYFYSVLVGMLALLQA